jgi:hypothetical protein
MQALENHTCTRHDRASRSGLAVVVALAALVLIPPGALAQPSLPSDREKPAAAPQETPQEAPQETPQEAQADMASTVADALYARARELHQRGDTIGAKTLLVESLELSAQGQRARDARALLGQVNRTLGLREDDRRVPLMPPPAAARDIIEPFQSGAAADEPLDPYGDMAAEPLDPYADSGLEDVRALRSVDDESVPLPPDDLEGDRRRSRRTMLLHGGLIGFTTGLALGGPIDEFGDVSAGAVLVGAVGAAGSIASAHFLTRKYEISEGQAAAVSWFGIWGATGFGYLADLATGVGTSTANEITRGVAVGGLIGTGAGILYARKHDPSVGDVALVNSFGMYGMTSALLLGVAMKPRESEGYSINALLGGALGIGAGMYAAGRIDTSRRRMFYVDLGASAGALVPWLLLYPTVSGNESGAQVTGLMSALGLVIGGYATWRFTSKMDRSERIGRKRIAGTVNAPPVPGLIQRDQDGRWGVGMLMLRPVVTSPLLAPGSSSSGLGVDLVGGRF